MYSSKGTTLYQDGIEIAYLRAYDTLNRDKYQFVAQVADALNAMALADRLASALTDLVGLVKAPDKNLQYYASQVRSALLEADKVLDDKRLHDYNLAGRQVEQDRKDLDQVTLGEPLDADDVGLGAMAFDSSLSEVGLAATLSAPTIKLDATVPPGKSAIIREAALKLGLDVVEIPMREPLSVEGFISAEPEVAPPKPGAPDKWESVIVLPNISRVQRDAILAGLRLLQQEITGDRRWRPIDIIDEIAGDSGTVIAAEDIDGLCRAFHIG